MPEKIAKQEIAELEKELKGQEQVNNLSKIDVTPDSLKSLLGLFSVLFICGGIFYIQFYLRFFFGIEVSKFFTLQDYLSTSVDKMFINLIAMVVSIVFLNAFLSKGDSKKNTEHDKHNNRKNIVIAKIIIIVSFTIGLIISIIRIYMFKDPSGYYFLGTVLAIVSLILVDKIFKQYFQKPRQIFRYFAVTTIFLSMLLIDAMVDSETIIRNDLKKIKNYKITFDENLNIDEASLVLLTSNSNYFFFYDKKDKKTYIIPAKLIVYIETENNK